MIHPAYMAGIADSDGSFSLVLRHKKRKNPHYFACFQLGWKQTEDSLIAMNKIKAQYGGTFSFAAPSEGSYGRTKMLKYMLQGKKLELFLTDILPFLILKKEQAEILLKLRKTITINNGCAKDEKLLKTQQDMYLKMKELNSKNSAKRFGAIYESH